MNFQETYRRSVLNEAQKRVIQKRQELDTLLQETYSLMTESEQKRFLTMYQEGFFNRIGNFFTGKGGTLDSLKTNTTATATALTQVITAATNSTVYKDDSNLKNYIAQLNEIKKQFDALLGNVTTAEQNNPEPVNQNGQQGQPTSSYPNIVTVQVTNIVNNSVNIDTQTIITNITTINNNITPLVENISNGNGDDNTKQQLLESLYNVIGYIKVAETRQDVDKDTLGSLKAKIDNIINTLGLTEDGKGGLQFNTPEQQSEEEETVIDSNEEEISGEPIDESFKVYPDNTQINVIMKDLEDPAKAEETYNRIMQTINSGSSLAEQLGNVIQTTDLDVNYNKSKKKWEITQ